MLDVLAPENSQELWTELCDRHAVCSESQVVVEGRSEKETDLLNAFAESYLNAQHWSTRRQILSLMADKLSLKEMREFIPTVTSYRYNIARRHTPQADIWKSCSSSKPGEKENEDWICKIRTFRFFHNESTRYSRCSFLKLSTSEIIKTPNVVRTMIPERIVQQYQQLTFQHQEWKHLMI